MRLCQHGVRPARRLPPCDHLARHADRRRSDLRHADLRHADPHVADDALDDLCDAHDVGRERQAHLRGAERGACSARPRPAGERGGRRIGRILEGLLQVLRCRGEICPAGYRPQDQIRHDSRYSRRHGRRQVDPGAADPPPV